MKNKKKVIAAGVILMLSAVIAIIVFILIRSGYFRVIKVENYAGEVTYERNGGQQDVFEDMNLKSGDVVTTGHDANIELLADSDKHIAAEGDTCFSIESRGTAGSGKITIVMQYGTALYTIDEKLNDKSEFEVETPNATLSVRGTVFNVTCDEGNNTTVVDVLEGKVRAVTESDKIDINAGESIMIKDDEIIEGEIAAIYNASVGDIVTFGSYEQDNDLSNGTEPIEWYVLDNDQGAVLLLSVYALDSRKYHDEDVDSITWEECSLRRWLNDDFYNAAFTEDEQKWIAESHLVNEDNPVYGTDGGNDTVDNVFLLSHAEVEKYFAPEYEFLYNFYYGERTISQQELCGYWFTECDPRLTIEGTDYAHSHGANATTVTVTMMGTEKYEAGTSWWLRSPGKDALCIARIRHYEKDLFEGVNIYSALGNGVRPAVRIEF